MLRLAGMISLLHFAHCSEHLWRNTILGSILYALHHSEQQPVWLIDRIAIELQLQSSQYCPAVFLVGSKSYLHFLPKFFVYSVTWLLTTSWSCSNGLRKVCLLVEHRSCLLLWMNDGWMSESCEELKFFLRTTGMNKGIGKTPELYIGADC